MDFDDDPEGYFDYDVDLNTGHVNFHCGYSRPIVSMYDECSELVMAGEDTGNVVFVVIFMPNWGYHAIEVPTDDDLADWEEAYH